MAWNYNQVILPSDCDSWDNKAEKTLATPTVSGLLSFSDKVKLNSIESGAQKNPEFASKAQAEEGTNTNRVMNPLRVKEAIVSQVETFGYATTTELTTAINGIEVGLRNFLRGSSSEWRDYDFTGWTTQNQDYTLAELGLSIGDTLYATGEYNVISGTDVGMQVVFVRPGLSLIHINSNRIPVGEKGKVSSFGTIPSGTESITIRHVHGGDNTTRKTGKFRLTGVYKSTVPVDWTPSSSDESFYTSNVEGSNAGKWTLFAQTKLTTRYAESICGFDLVGTGSANSVVYYARLFIRHKQQEVLGSPTFVEIALLNSSSVNISTNDFKAVVIQNNTNGIIVNYYIRNNISFVRFKFSPFNKFPQPNNSLNFYENQEYIESLPTGTTINAVERGIMARITQLESRL